MYLAYENANSGFSVCLFYISVQGRNFEYRSPRKFSGLRDRDRKLFQYFQNVNCECIKAFSV